MKFWDRVIGFLAGIILAVFGVLMLLIIFKTAGPLVSSLNNPSIKELWWLMLIGFISLITAIYLFSMAFRTQHEEKTIIGETSLGEIRITVSAVENLALRAVRKLRGVKEAHVGVRADLSGLDIFIEVTVNPDLSIPQISEEIKTRVDEYVYETVGMRVNSVKVLVTKVAMEAKTRLE